MSWPIYLAFKQLFPTGRVSFFTLISMLGVGLGVALMLVSTSVMGGFGHEIQRMIVDTQGEIQVRARAPIGGAQAVAAEKALAAAPEVAAFAPYATGVVMLEYDNRPAFPSIQGFDPDKLCTIERLPFNISRTRRDTLGRDLVRDPEL